MSVKNAGRQGLMNLEGAASEIDGVYINRKFDSANQLPLWNVFTERHRHGEPDTLYQPGNSRIKLTSQGQKRILAQLYFGDKKMGQEILKGKFKNQYFIARRKIHYSGVPVIFMGYSSNKYHISKDSSGILYIDGARTAFGWILLFVAGSDYRYHYKFELG